MVALARAETKETWTPRLWGTLVVLCGALFLDGLDVSMVGVALPSIQRDLGMSTAALQWVVSGYVLGYGGLLLLGGRAADLLGRRRVFLVALAVFAAASIAGALVDDGTLLVATRLIKGAAAAFTAPAGLSIITTTFPEGPARNRALGIYTVCGASGFSMGLVLGGLMTEVGWRWTFLAPAPVALAVLLFAIRLIPASPRTPHTRGYDVAGAATVTSALLLLVYAVVTAPTAPPVRTVLTLVGVAALLAAFVAIERRVAHPLVRLGILRSGRLVRANVGTMAIGSYLGFQFVATLYLQNVLEWSPLQMALALLPGGLIVAFSGPFVGRLMTRYGAPRLALVGFLFFLAGYAWFLRIGPEPAYASVVLPTMLLIGSGFGLAFPALNIQATSGVADEEQGLASGLVQSGFQIGGAVTMAVVAAIVTGTTTHTGSVPGQFYTAMVFVSAVALLGAVVAGLGLRRAHA